MPRDTRLGAGLRALGRRGKSRNSSGCLILPSANETWMGLRCFAGHYPKLT